VSSTGGTLHGALGATEPLESERGMQPARTRAFRPRELSIAKDALVIAALLMTAFLTRLGALPEHGLWYDDAWVATGALKGSLSQLLMVGSAHPGFTAVLMGWGRIGGGDAGSMAAPALIAGTLGPTALYIALRQMGYARSVSTFLGAAAVACQTHVVYSGRVKTYVIDVLIVIGLMVLLPHLARRTWTWRVGATWFACALLIASLSAFALLAVAVAGAILVLHPASDRHLRLVAVGAQMLSHVVYVNVVEGTYNGRDVGLKLEESYDVYFNFDPNPFVFGREVLERLGHIVVVFPGGADWFVPIAISISLIGLAMALLSARRDESIRARFLLMILLAALVGGLTEKIPFGPLQGKAFSGGRFTLWLLPVVAVGLAAGLHRFRGLLRVPVGVMVLDTVAFLLSVVIVIGALRSDAPRYPQPGAQRATEFMESELGVTDVALIMPGGDYPFTVDSHYEVELRAQPRRVVGFAPVFDDPRLVVIDSGVGNRPELLTQEVLDVIDGRNRVLVHEAWITAVPPESRVALAYTLTVSGFEREESRKIEDALVSVWRRRSDGT
jgi:hypothetical protein